MTFSNLPVSIIDFLIRSQKRGGRVEFNIPIIVSIIAFESEWMVVQLL